MARKFIKASEVLKGDTIRVSFTVEDATITRQGTVDRATEVLSGRFMFSTRKGYSLGPTAESGITTTIQLLDRPKPVLVLPTGEYAVISYQKYNDEKWIGVLRDGHWVFKKESEVDDKDAWTFSEHPSQTATLLTENGRKNYTVLFAGVTK